MESTHSFYLSVVSTFSQYLAIEHTGVTNQQMTQQVSQAIFMQHIFSFIFGS